MSIRRSLFYSGFVALATLSVAACSSVAAQQTVSTAAVTAKAGNVYDFTMKDIDGHEVSLSQFKGKVLLIVNVASKCGNTPQYAGLEKLYEGDKDKGFAILGFPANQFGGQEPGTDEQIKQFCTGNYNVTFPMFSKIVVKGDGINPLYTYLIASAPYHDDIEWNFGKFLVGRDGKVIARFNPKVQPDDPELVADINKALEAK